MKPKIVRNVDNSANALGKITNYVEVNLRVGGHEEQTRFSVTGIGEDDLILGLPWLRRHNPSLNWRKGQMLFQDCPISCQITMKKKKRQAKKPLLPIRSHRTARIRGGMRTVTKQFTPKSSTLR